MRKFLIVVAAVAFAVWYLHRPDTGASTITSSSGSGTSPGPGCLMNAEHANTALGDAARLLLSMPVDTSKWSDAESAVSSAISTAESSCSGATTDAERAGMEEVRSALTLMRETLSEASHAALGAGGFHGAARQEAIDSKLASARSKFGLR
jgi:hypothetical protein